MYCTQCGAPNDDRDRFCQNCGAPLEAEEEQYQQSMYQSGQEPLPPFGDLPEMEPEHKGNGKKILIACVVILVIVIAIAAGIFLFSGKDSSDKDEKKESKKTESVEEDKNSDADNDADDQEDADSKSDPNSQPGDEQPAQNQQTTRTVEVYPVGTQGTALDPASFSITASSTLQENGYDHSAEILRQGSPGKAWSEGVSGTGVGETVYYTSDSEQTIDTLYIRPGHQKSADAFYANACPTEIRIYYDGMTTIAKLRDTDFNGSSELAYLIDLGGSYKVKDCSVSIAAVRAGNTYSDTCISEMYFYHQAGQ